jgi:hypothetical protein
MELKWKQNGYKSRKGGVNETHHYLKYQLSIKNAFFTSTNGFNCQLLRWKQMELKWKQNGNKMETKWKQNGNKCRKGINETHHYLNYQLPIKNAFFTSTNGL